MPGPTPRKVINVSPPVLARFQEYKAALRRDHGRRTTNDELVGALLEGVPLWQADLMIRAYNLHPLDEQVDAEHDEDESAQTG